MCGTQNEGYVKRPIISAVAAWKNGFMEVSDNAPEGFRDAVLSVEWLDGGARPGAMELRLTLLPDLRWFVGAGGREGPVHSFRYRRADGHVAHLLVCCQCGHVAHAAAEELQGIGLGDCRACGTPASTADCPAWHTWGACLRCAAGPVFESARRTVASLHGEPYSPWTDGPVPRFDSPFGSVGGGGS